MAIEQSIDVEQELNEIAAGICNELSVLEVLAKALDDDEHADEQLVLKRAIAGLAGWHSRLQVVEAQMSPATA